jgi:hypothetical protein
LPRKARPRAVTVFFSYTSNFDLQDRTGSIGKGYRILVFIEITILAIEAPLPEMHKSMPRMGADFALATDPVAILRLRRNFAPLIIFIH